MTREDAIALINAERAAQDATWKDRSQYTRSAPHILILDVQLTKLKQEWYGSPAPSIQDRLVKMAAIALRALEEIEPKNAG